MAKYRSYSISFKRQLIEEYVSGASVRSLSQRYDVGRALIRLWARKAEAGGFDDELVTARTLTQYEARIEALERLAGKQALELEFLKRALELTASRRSETPSIVTGPSAPTSSASRKDAD
jgi:transposase